MRTMFHVKASYTGASRSNPTNRTEAVEIPQLPWELGVVVPTKERAAQLLGDYFCQVADAVDAGWQPTGGTWSVASIQVDD